MQTLRIGQVARAAAVSVEAIRFYEKQGLVEAPRRSASGYRQYDPGTVRRVRFIQRAKDMGFTLSEIKDLLTLRTAPGVSCADVKQHATEKIAQIEQRIAELQRMQRALSRLADQCAGHGPVGECPILDALDSNGSS